MQYIKRYLEDGLKAFFEKYNFKKNYQGIDRKKLSNLYLIPSATQISTCSKKNKGAKKKRLL
jgi:hypothetical protein